jgi:tRNA uridine 5-carboxymethylaminomethyl modification enzyme
VMIDDLVTRGVSEPYRMFTSRAEFRLKLRADNADQRLTPLGQAVGCVERERSGSFAAKVNALGRARGQLEALSLSPSEAGRHGLEINKDGRRRTAFELLSYPGIDFERLTTIWPDLAGIGRPLAAQIETDARYAAYVQRQEEDVAVLRRDEAEAIPLDFDYDALPGLSTEMRQKLSLHRPATLAQAGRIDGVTPAALMLVLARLKSVRRGQRRA